MTEQTVTHVKCPECGSTSLVQDMEMGEYICSTCGLVIRETFQSAFITNFTVVEEEYRMTKERASLKSLSIAGALYGLSNSKRNS